MLHTHPHISGPPLGEVPWVRGGDLPWRSVGTWLCPVRSSLMVVLLARRQPARFSNLFKVTRAQGMGLDPPLLVRRPVVLSPQLTSQLPGFLTFSAVESSSVEIFTEVLVGHSESRSCPKLGVPGPPALVPQPQGGPRALLGPVDSVWAIPGFGSFSVRGAVLYVIGILAASLPLPPRCQ